MEQFFPHFAIPQPEGAEVEFGLANERVIEWFLSAFLEGGLSRWWPWRTRRAVHLLCRAVGVPAPEVRGRLFGGQTIAGFDSRAWKVNLYEGFWRQSPENKMATVFHELRHAEQQWLATRWALANWDRPGVADATLHEVAGWVLLRATPLPATDPRYPFAAAWWRSMIGPESVKIMGVNAALHHISVHPRSGQLFTAVNSAMWSGREGDTRLTEGILRALPARQARVCLGAIRTVRAYRTMPHESDAFHLSDRVERLAQRHPFS